MHYLHKSNHSVSGSIPRNSVPIVVPSTEAFLRAVQQPQTHQRISATLQISAPLSDDSPRAAAAAAASAEQTRDANQETERPFAFLALLLLLLLSLVSRPKRNLPVPAQRPLPGPWHARASPHIQPSVNSNRKCALPSPLQHHRASGAAATRGDALSAIFKSNNRKDGKKA